MTIKKTEFHSFFWTGCDELLGGRDYVLTLLFMESYLIDTKTMKKRKARVCWIKIIGISYDKPQDAGVYDPTCSSGILLKIGDEAPRGLRIFGHEMDSAISNNDHIKQSMMLELLTKRTHLVSG